MFSYTYTDPDLPTSGHSSLPVIGAGREPEWFTRKVAAVTRLRETEREKRIARLSAGRPELPAVVRRVRTALGLA